MKKNKEKLYYLNCTQEQKIIVCNSLSGLIESLTDSLSEWDENMPPLTTMKKIMSCKTIGRLKKIIERNNDLHYCFEVDTEVINNGIH